MFNKWKQSENLLEQIAQKWQNAYRWQERVKYSVNWKFNLVRQGILCLTVEVSCRKGIISYGKEEKFI